MLFLKRAGSAALFASASLVVGCGGDDSSSGAKESETSSQEAIAEIAAVRTGLDDALASYETGDRAVAETKVGDAYLEHFEHVEGPLGKLDAELNEQLEEALKVELRDMMKAGAPEREVEALAKEIGTNLDRAEAALK